MGKDAQRRPKVNVSPYIHFVMDFRKKTKREHPNTSYDFAEFSRRCSEKWKTISTREKAKYEARAQRDKDRYEREKRNYTGPRRQRKPRDANAPRKPPSSFLLFAMDHYDQLKEQHPNWTVAEVARATGRMWSKTAEADKIRYEEQAALLREKYVEEREAYNLQLQDREDN